MPSATSASGTSRRAAALAGLIGIAAGGCLAAEESADEAARAAGLLAAPELLAFEASGTWPATAPGGAPFARGWIDARVANRRHHKRVLAEVVAPHPAGFAHTLHPMAYEGELGGGMERWGTDTLELFGGDGAGPVMARLRLQHDADGDGVDEMVVTPWRRIAGVGDAAAPPDERWLATDSPIAPDGAPLDVVFAPFQDPGETMIAAIDDVIARQRAAPGERHTLHAAVFNVTDDQLIDRLIEAHRTGVDVRVVFDGRKLRPWYEWYRGDDRLIGAGVPVLGAFRPGGAMHDKLVILDGRRMATGSFNWEPGARHENHEALFTSGEPTLVTAYAERFTALAGGPLTARTAAADPSAAVSVSFAPDEAPQRILGRLIDGATRSIHVAMFTCKDVAYDDTSLFQRLATARRRGVDVQIILDHGIHEASEYRGVISEDDPSDEWLEAQGIHVVRADNTRSPHASMHHKLAVIDGEVVVAGAFNWYFDAAYRNDEDQLVVRDRALAARVTGELAALIREYDPAWNPDAWPRVKVTFAVHDSRTQWGDTVAIAGELSELGAWSPAAALALDGASWPVWTGTVDLPAGSHLRWKAITRKADGSTSWEPGADRTTIVPTGGDTTVVRIDAR